MDSNDEKAISALRNLSRQFVLGQLPFEEFYGVFCKTAHCLFDADQSLMPQPLAHEVEFYLRWEGFGPRIGHVPENDKWRYGEPEAFGWIDKSAFAERFTEEFTKLVPPAETYKGHHAEE